MRHLVVGTAGHIDHGKSALVEALTGVHPDRLEEEQRRGITIDLGFADLELAPEGVVSLVDVPGHERFVRHMVAGASGLDAVLLVVAADEGVKPQTREHLAICTLLDVRHGLVVLSKADLVDDELREVASLEVRDALRGTFLEDAPIVPVSARTGAGLDVLRQRLRELIVAIPERPSEGVARLPIDRSFVLRGFGTVVTGTLVAGRLEEGQDVEILPGGRRGRVRGLQVHKKKVAQARAGRRVAVNLQGLDCDDAPRGATVTSPGALLPTRRARAAVELLANAPARLRRGGPVRFHQGTCERAARLRAVTAGESRVFEADLVFAEDTVLLPGDRFILRRPAPVDTVGGGVVLDAHPAKGRSGARDATATATVSSEAACLDRISRAGDAGRSPASVGTELGRSLDEIEGILRGPLADGRVVRAAGLVFDGAAWRRVAAGVEAALGAFHEAEPLRAGMPREALRSGAARAMTQEAFRELLHRMASDGHIVLLGERVAIAGHRVVLSAADAVHVQRIEDAFRRAGLNPPSADEVVRDVGGTHGARLLGLLVEQGRLVKIRDGRLFHGEALDDVRRRLRAFGRTSSTIDVVAFKDLAGVTRKNAIPLLEQFDQERLTRREGNVRRILTDETAQEG